MLNQRKKVGLTRELFYFQKLLEIFLLEKYCYQLINLSINIISLIRLKLKDAKQAHTDLEARKITGPAILIP